MRKCACGGNLREYVVEKDGVKMKSQKCSKCGEVYIPGSEMLKYDIIKGRSSIVRKIRKSGDSMIVTVPKQIFEPHEKEIKIKIIHTA